MLQRDAAPGIHRVEDAYVNWYLVEDDGARAITIVDAGLPRSWRTLQSALAELGRTTAGSIDVLDDPGAPPSGTTPR